MFSKDNTFTENYFATITQRAQTGSAKAELCNIADPDDTQNLMGTSLFNAT